MKSMIEAEVQRKEYRDNIKLGRGGIREIEFIVQTLQLVRGGTIPALRERRLLVGLDKLIRPGCLTAEESLPSCSRLTAFLRRQFENRLQAINDRQTHDVPADEMSRERADRGDGGIRMGSTGGDPVELTVNIVSGHFQQHCSARRR